MCDRGGSPLEGKSDSDGVVVAPPCVSSYLPVGRNVRGGKGDVDGTTSGRTVESDFPGVRHEQVRSGGSVDNRPAARVHVVSAPKMVMCVEIPTHQEGARKAATDLEQEIIRHLCRAGTQIHGGEGKCLWTKLDSHSHNFSGGGTKVPRGNLLLGK